MAVVVAAQEESSRARPTECVFFNRALRGLIVQLGWIATIINFSPATYCWIQSSGPHRHHRHPRRQQPLSFSLVKAGFDTNNSIEKFQESFVTDDEEPSLIAEEKRLRFASVGRLYAHASHKKSRKHVATALAEPTTDYLEVVERLQSSTVVVVGLGGVGSWSAEALCRSGVGHICLVDLDDICISNTNRQLHTLSSTVGKMKIDAMKSRLLDVNPACNVTLIHDFVSAENVNDILDRCLDQKDDRRRTVVLDAIDGSKEKSALLAACADRKISVVTSGGAAGRTDPTKIFCADLTEVTGDKLLSTCRRNLRKFYGFAQGLPFHQSQQQGRKAKKWNIDAVYSTEQAKGLPSSGEDVGPLRRCDGVLGTACFVTGTFGFVAAARVVDMIASGRHVIPSKS